MRSLAKPIIQWKREARLSDDSRYRFLLRRSRVSLSSSGSITFIMLNPSIADASVDDATTRRCMAFAIRERKSRLNQINLFAAIATNPIDLWRHPDPVGNPQNYHTWDGLARFCNTPQDMFVAAWGASPSTIKAQQQHDTQVSMLVDLFCNKYGYVLYCLGTTSHGQPRHPLYVSAGQEFIKWR